MTGQYHLSPVEDALNVLLVLADSLAEVSVADLEPELGLEHLGGVVHVHVGPGHVLQRVVSDGKALSQVQAQRLPPIGEDVKCNLDKMMRILSLRYIFRRRMNSPLIFLSACW